MVSALFWSTHPYVDCVGCCICAPVAIYLSEKHTALIDLIQKKSLENYETGRAADSDSYKHTCQKSYTAYQHKYACIYIYTCINIYIYIYMYIYI